MTKQYDPENDDAADAIDPAQWPFGADDDDTEFDSTTNCPECGDPLEGVECVNPFCPENPDNILDDDDDEED